jgi:hypothetical protein
MRLVSRFKELIGQTPITKGENTMARKPAPVPTLEDLAWAIYDSMLDARMQLSEIWSGYGNRSFWYHVALYINTDFHDRPWVGNEVGFITERGVHRLVRKNWDPLVRRLTEMLEGDDFFADIPIPKKGRIVGLRSMT